MKIFLSYSSRDRGVAEAVVGALKEARPSLEVFFDQHALTVGGFWMPRLHEEIAKADGFVFLFGDKLGPWQTLEYYGAFDRRAKAPALPIAPVLLGEAGVPGLPFFNQLHWVKADPTSPDAVARILASLDGGAETPPQELWRLVNPYRGLQALREEDAALLHGRDDLVRQLLEQVAHGSSKVTIAVGNSGVGKSSLVYAGVFAALARQNWINAGETREWPAGLADSRSWLRLALKPSGKGGGSDNPLRELARTFIGQWRDATKPDYHADVDAWTTRLESAKAPVDELIHASDSWAEAQGLPAPKRYVLYVDQAEELYTRVDRRAAEKFSRVLGEASHHDRIRVLMSLRADFYGKLQDDTALFAASEKVDIPKLDEPGFRAVVSRPAGTLGAAFEEGLDEELVRAAAVQPAGLPLLSYQLTETWNEMVGRGDGMLRWPRRTDTGFDLARALIDRADGYLKANPGREDAVRRLFCVRLVHVPEQGAPTRRVALQDELSAEEQSAAQDLASPDYRLLAAGETDAGKASVEVGHEALLTAWERLRNWIADRRGFYAWRTRLEGDRKEWERAGKPKNGLLSGRALEIAQGYAANYGADIPAPEAAFVAQSADVAMSAQRARRLIGAGAFAVLLVALVTVSWFGLEARRQRDASMETQSRFLAQQAPGFLSGGDPESAMMLALEALPVSLSSPDRPYVDDAMSVLLSVWPALQTQDITTDRSNSYRQLAISSGGVAASYASDTVVRLWDARTGLPQGAPLRHTKPIGSVALSDDGSRVATAADKLVRMWDGRTGEPMGPPIEHGEVVDAMLLTSDGSRIVTGAGGSLAIWEFGTGRLVGDRIPYEGPIDLRMVSPDGKTFVVLRGSTAQRWSLVTGLHVGKPLELGGKALSAAFSPDGTRLLTATAGAARLWNATTDAPVGSAVMPSDEVQAVEFGTDGRHAVVVSGRWESGDQGLVGPSVVHALDAENGRVLMTLRLTSVAADFGIAAGKLWVASSNELQVWKLSDAGSTQPDRLAGAFRDASPDGRYFLLRDPDPAKSAAALWDSETGRKLDLLDVAKINWSSSSRFFVGASYRFLAIGDPSHGVSAPGKALWSYASAAFVSPKRTQVLLVGQNSSLLDLTTRKVQWTSSTPFSEVPMTAAWSESGARVFSWRGLSEARDIQVWDVARGLARQISLPLPPEHGISNAGVLDAQGRYIYVTVQKMLSNYSAPYSARDTDQLWIVDADAGVLVGKSSTPVVQYSEVKSDGERMFFRTGPSALALHSIVDNARVAALEQPNVTAFGFVGRPARPFTLASAQGKFLSPGRFTVWNSNLSLPTMVVDDVVSVVPAPDKLQMAVIVDEGAAYAVDVLDGVGRRRLLTLPCTFATAEFSPDGRELLTICGLTAQLWDVRTGKQIGTSVRTRGLGGTPAFAGGGTRILIFPENGTLEVWDDKMGGPIGPAMPFSAADNLVVSDDGEYALIAPGYSGAGSRSLKVRALRTGIESQVGVDGPGVPAAANPDVWFSSTGPGLFLVKGGSGYEVPLPPRCQALIDWAWSVARNRHLALTPEQRKQFALPKSAERVRASGFMSFFGNLFWSPRVTCQ